MAIVGARHMSSTTAPVMISGDRKIFFLMPEIDGWLRLWSATYRLGARARLFSQCAYKICDSSPFVRSIGNGKH